MYGIQESTAGKERKIAAEVTKLYDNYSTERNECLGRALIASSEFVNIAEALSRFGIQEVRQCERTGRPYAIIYIDSNCLPSEDIMDCLRLTWHIDLSRNKWDQGLTGVTNSEKNVFEIRPRRGISLTEKINKFVDIEVDCRKEPSVRIM